MPEDTRRDVARYDALRNVIPTDQIMQTINGGATQEERQAYKIRQSEAQDLLAKKDGKTPKIDQVLKSVIDEYDGFFNLRPTVPWIVTQKLQQQAEALWANEYALHGNADVAQKVTNKTIKERWGVTSLGGNGGLLMELPPERAGYKTLGGDFGWIDKQVRKDMVIPEGGKYQLISDEQTRQEFAAFQRNVEAQPPSYRIAVIDKDGVARIDQKKRMYFKPDEEAIQLQVDLAQEKSDLEAASIASFELDQMQRHSKIQGFPVPEELIEREAELRARAKEILARQRGRITENYDAKSSDLNSFKEMENQLRLVEPEMPNALR